MNGFLPLAVGLAMWVGAAENTGVGGQAVIPGMKGLTDISEKAMGASAGLTAVDVIKQGAMGAVHLERTAKLSEPAKYSLLSLDSTGRPYASLIVTESNKVLAGPAAGPYREVLRSAAISNDFYAWPDVLGRSLGVIDKGTNGAFYLIDHKGNLLAKVPELNGYNMIFSEPTRPLILSRPNGGWAGWPSLWHTNGSRNEGMSHDWPDGHAVKAIRFSPNGDTIAVLSSREPSSNQFTVSAFNSKGRLRWRMATMAEGDWTQADIAYSNSGRLLALATRTKLLLINSKGNAIKDMPIASPSEQHFCFSKDDKRAVLASGNIVHIIDLSSKQQMVTWNVNELQVSRFLPAGEAHLSRVVCSSDGKTIALSGRVSIRVPWNRPDGILAEKMIRAADFVALLRNGLFLDVISLPPGTLLQDLGESRAGSGSIAISTSGDRVFIPSRFSLFTYALSD